MTDRCPGTDSLAYPGPMQLPVGVYHVDMWGIVQAHVSVATGVLGPSRVIGRNFFEEVAPCTNCADFRGRFEALVRQGGGSEAFMYRLRYPWLTAEVRVRMFGTSSRGAWILLANPEVCERYAPEGHAKVGRSEL